MAPVSRLFVNPTFDGALDLVDRYKPVNIIHLSYWHGLTIYENFRLEAMGVRQAEPVEYIWPNEDQSHIRDEMLSLYPRKTITQLIETTEVWTKISFLRSILFLILWYLTSKFTMYKQNGIFVVHAGIVGLIRDGHWSYPSCRCYAELLGLGGRFECLKCGRIVGNMQRRHEFIHKINYCKFIYMIKTTIRIFTNQWDYNLFRYRLKLEVFDGYASSIFVLHDSETRHFMNLSCEDLILNMQVFI